MRDWIKKRFKESSVQIIDGDRGVNYPKKTDFLTSGHCLFLNTGNVTKTGFDFSNTSFVTKEKDEVLRKGKLKRGDIVLTTRGTVGNVGYFSDEIIYSDIRINSGMVILRVDESKISSYYLYLFLRSDLFKAQVLKQGSGSAQPQLPIQNLNNIVFPWFTLITQKQIAKVLSDLDAKIEVNNNINQELEAMAKTLYNYWFVQFDFPDANGKPYKSSGGKMVFNEELKREIPEGWEVKQINDVIEVKDGTHDSPKPIEKGFKLITSKHLKSEGLDFASANSICEEDYININKRSKVDTGDILFSMIGNIGTIYKVEERTIDFAIKNVALYKTSEHQNLKNYIYMYLRGYDMQRYMGNVIAGSIQKFIGLGSLRKMPLMIDEKTISNFENKTKSIFNEINTLKLENQKLSELRDWLLPMLMNGQVSITNKELEITNNKVDNKLGMVAEDGEMYKKE